jgi:putative ABC transport system permease protein
VRDLNLLNLALQNLRRKPYRSVAIGLCVAVATGSLFIATIVLRGVQTSLTVGRARLGADLIVVPQGYEAPAQEAFITGQPTTFYMPEQIEAQIAAQPGVRQTSAQVFVQTLTNARCCIGEFFLVGFDPETDFTVSPWLVTHLEGASLGPLDIIAGDRILLREGDGATFYGTAFTVAGVLERTGMGIDRTIYVPMQGLRQMIADSAELAEQPLEIDPGEISSVLVSVEQGADILDVAESIEGHLSGVQVFTATQLNQAVARQLRGVMGITFAVTASLWLMSLLMIGLVFSLIINERQRELGLLRAMGARAQIVFRLVIGEAGLLTGLGGLAGLLAAGVLLMSFSRLIQLRLRIPYLVPGVLEIVAIEVGMLLLALLTGALASLQPALASSRMEPYAAIRMGE